ncbi:MAG: winged helix-turn-helix transcriptional regulator [Myxococcota bacterium]
MSGIQRLLPLFHRRWAASVLVHLAHPDTARTGRARVSAIASMFGANREAVRQSVRALESVQAVERNPGHGHPLRPELRLTERGQRLAPHFKALHDLLTELGHRDLGLRKWPMPALYAVGAGPTRFGAISDQLPKVTDRALSQALRRLREAELIDRTMNEDQPPRPVYQSIGRGLDVVTVLNDLVQTVD